MKRQAFTLIEILVAIAIMTVLLGMVTMALGSAQADARRARAKSQLQKIQEIVMDEWDGYSSRRFSISPSPANGREAARARMLLMRDTMRIEFPDRKSDLLIPAAAGASTRMQFHAGTSASPVPSLLGTPQLDRLLMYRQKIVQMVRVKDASVNNWASAVPKWTNENESAECLYLIMSTISFGGRSALDAFRPSEIGDTDNNGEGDGVLEILDPWGNAVTWIRWPAGYWHFRATSQGDTRSMDDIFGPDNFDILRTDWRFPNPAFSSTGSNVFAPFNISPIIVSSGLDGELDLDLGDSVNYGTMTYTPPSGYATSGTYYYPDPYANYESYLTDLGSGTTPSAYPVGTPLDTNSNGYDGSIDNIYSSEL